MINHRRRFLQGAVSAGLYAGLGAPGLSLSVFAQNASPGPAPMMPGLHYVDTNGIRMAVYEQGTGPAVVFCHGFPELALSWRNQIGPVAAAGFHAIVPDMRGYGLTGGSDDVSDYGMDVFCADLIGLLDAKGIDKAVFVGHDWGGAVVWTMPRVYPDRCLGVIGLNTAANRPGNLPPVQGSEPSLIVRTADYYFNTFQEPGRAEAVLEADVRKSFDFFLSRGGIWNKDVFAGLPEDSLERRMDFLGMLQQGIEPGETFLSDEVMDYYVRAYEATGFTGGLNWYRSAIRVGVALANARNTIDVPCLYIGAEHDVILPPASADGMEDFIADLEKYTVQDSGHWTQQEQPDEVNRVILDWLARKMT
ncbi:MAG: alpha/beta hydrolase [Pseudohongiella sp.]|nr:alpha/beta hydrolase [Pseudohongiella sp.]